MPAPYPLGIIKVDGFDEWLAVEDSYHIGFDGAAGGGVQVAAAPGGTAARTGYGYFKVANDSDGCFVGWDMGTFRKTVVFHAALRVNTLPTGATDYVHLFGLSQGNATHRRGQGTGWQVSLHIRGSDRKLVAIRGLFGGSDTVLGESPNQLPADTAWRSIQASLRVDNTDGHVRVLLEAASGNMETFWTLDDVDTQASPTLDDAKYAIIGQPSPDFVNPGTPFSNQPYEYDLDDLAITETVQLGKVRADWLEVEADSSPLLLTAIGFPADPDGSNSRYVRDSVWLDFSPDQDSSYVDDAPSGGLDVYTLGDLPSPSGSILAVVAHPRMRRRTGTIGTGRSTLVIGGTQHPGDNKVLVETTPAFPDPGLGTLGFVPYPDIWELNPATSAAWTDADVNALEAGPESVTLGMECSGFGVYVLRLGIPCTGGPENPYPTDRPPTQPINVPLIWERRNLLWRSSPAPSVQYPDTARPQANLMSRPGHRIGIRKNLATRYPGDVTIDAEPEPDTEFPPFFDPCNLLPEIPPGHVVPMPLTDRFIGMSNAPLSVCGPVFNGAKNALGGWTPSDLGQCATKGVILTTAQGGRSQYQLGGLWDEDTFVSVTVAKLVAILSTLQARTITGEYFGHSAIDDFASPKLWPPSGVPLASLASALARIKAAVAAAAGLPNCPIRIGIRGRPSQFGFNPGADFYCCQFKAWAGQTASGFGANEYSIAASRSAFITMDLNYLHGGLEVGGTCLSGYRDNSGGLLAGHCACSANEIIDYLGDMFNASLAVDGTAQWLAGSLGYQYDPPYLSIVPGVIDAITTKRNQLAGFPPLP